MVELMGTTLENESVYRDAETVSADEFHAHEAANYFDIDGIQADGIRVYELEWRDKRPGAWRRYIHCRLYTKRRAGSKAFKSLVYEIKRAEPDTFGGTAYYRLVNSKSVYYKGFEPVL